MAVSNAQVSVTTTATALNTADREWLRMRVAVPSAGETVFLGDSSVTDANGCQVLAGDFIDLVLAPGDVVYGIVTTGPQTTHVLRTS